jgi:hypothetical protein
VNQSNEYEMSEACSMHGENKNANIILVARHERKRTW